MGAPRSVRGSGGGGGAKKPAAKPANGKAAKQEDLFDDEVDQFHADRAKARDHISLGDDDGSDDEDDEDDERLGDTYGLDGDDDEDEGEDDDSDDDDIDERFKPPTGGRMNLADDDDEGDGEEEDDRAPRKWGSKKSAYYGADDVDAEDSEDVEEDERADKLEEEEARRLQAAQLGLLQDDDFDDGQALGDLAKRAKAKGAPKPAARPRAGSALAALDDAFDTVALRGEAVAQVERRGRAADGAAAGARKRAHASNIVNGGEEGLSAAERLEIVTRDAPELLELLADLKAKLDETRSRVAPLVEAAHSGELKISGGLGYLETKLQLLLSYCTHLAFFLALKASGMKVREHPVVPQLVRLRAILEKLGPLDKKLRFQVDRLLQLAVADEGKAAAAAARPNPRALIAKGAGGMDGELEEEEEGEARKGRAGSVGIYRRPSATRRAAWSVLLAPPSCASCATNSATSLKSWRRSIWQRVRGVPEMARLSGSPGRRMSAGNTRRTISCGYSSPRSRRRRSARSHRVDSTRSNASKTSRRCCATARWPPTPPGSTWTQSWARARRRANAPRPA
ncbi:Sas10/Utp3/C1D family-domain-containing protein, partial [Pavlovales sp. CCMP2436]